MRVTYRGLERRWAAMDERIIDYIRTNVSPHLLERPDNLALAFATGSLPDGPYVVVSRTPVPAAVLSWRTFGAAYFAPLRIHEALDDRWVDNVATDLLERLAAAGIEADAEGILHYAYGVLNAPYYRDRYRDALRYDFARVPLARRPRLFDEIRGCGRELVLAHLLEHPGLTQALPAMDGDDRAVLEAPRYDAGSRTLYLAPGLAAIEIESEEWQYQQGAYRVLRDFVDARRGRQLTREEFNEFRLLAASVRLTLEQLPRLDELVAEAAEDACTAGELRVTERS